MEARPNLLTLCGFPFVLGLLYAVKMTALGLEAGIRSPRLWLGLPLLVLGIIGLECFRRAIPMVIADARAETRRKAGTAEGQERDPAAADRLERVLHVLHVFTVLLLQLIVVFEFIFLLDGHVHLRAALWLYLVYVVGAILVLAAGRASTRWGSCYLRWGWAPIIAFGIPLCLPALKSAGLVWFSPVTL